MALLMSERTVGAGDLDSVVRRLASSESILPAVREMRPLAEAARLAAPDEAFETLAGLVGRHADDPLAAYLAIQALGGVASPSVDDLMIRLLDSGEQGLREHAAWSLSRRRPVAGALPGLLSLAETGGFSQMMAELALEGWLREVPELAWVTGNPVPDRLHWLAERPPRPPNGDAAGPGLRIAQILMQGRVDAGLTAPGSGDGGGLVTLQVGLTDELAKHDAVDEVYLVTRSIGESGRFAHPLERIGSKGALARLSFGGPGYVPTSQMWPYRPELERQLREFLIAEGPFDALHLRFADVGTFAAARVGEELGIPIFFTLAPDPHAVIASAEASGQLTREGFAAADLSQHYLFRAWMVDWMLDAADRLALLPREEQERQFRALLGVDLSEDPDRFVVIPEGVDYTVAQSAARTVAQMGKDGPAPRVVEDLARAVADLPEARRGLPIILTVGRLNRVKGMDRVVESWAGDPVLRSGFNLVVVGGNLADPSLEEREVLDAITSVMAGAVGPDTGLILMGSRPHRDVAFIMAAVALGVPGLIRSNGIYVSGSEKEEFGLAIVEALAAGLPVVAPSTGGPSTYVDHGFTGYLGDTRDVGEIRKGIRWADRARLSEVRADASRRLVRSEYSLRAMADGLVDLYMRNEATRVAS